MHIVTFLTLGTNTRWQFSCKDSAREGSDFKQQNQQMQKVHKIDQRNTCLQYES